MYLTLSSLLSLYYRPPCFSFCAPLLYEFPGRKTQRKAYVDADLIGRSRSLSFFSFPIRKRKERYILEPRKLAVIEQTNTTIIL